MKIVISGGTGQVGTILSRALTAAGHDVVVLTRRPVRDHDVRWDAEALGPWAKELDGSDIVINLAGRSVNCRYTPDNLRAMMDSRVGAGPGASPNPAHAQGQHARRHGDEPRPRRRLRCHAAARAPRPWRRWGCRRRPRATSARQAWLIPASEETLRKRSPA
ncbi:NAD-dependent epimerase/dehydratase family protein [Nonomuraea sp. NPDC049028]|uniref:NAD-dependent epimerase/dehydratase family protein n=1 Tax=Nonomuraea sp. NPDC049028 TaxID=3364348 RepID=UPI003722845D